MTLPIQLPAAAKSMMAAAKAEGDSPAGIGTSRHSLSDRNQVTCRRANCRVRALTSSAQVSSPLTPDP
jgi:hypothetical protein